MKDPVVSVIIPHYNRTRLLAETVDSVKKQSLEAWEIIIVDDGSEESEWEKLQQFGEEKVRICQRGSQPKGPSACRNIGIKEAKGEYVIFLDSDDLLAPWCLESRIKDFRENPGFDFLVYPSLLFEQTPGDSNRLWNKTDDASDHLERFLYSDPSWCVTGPIWKRESFINLGGFNEEVFYGDDAELHIRAILYKLKYIIIDNELPDNFIRRNAEERITSGINSLILESRLTFLKVVMELLREFKCNTRFIKIWEGEYFSEIEFRMFNKQKELIETVLQVFKSYLSSFVLKKWLSSYCLISAFLIDKTYLAFRITRKLFLLGFPDSYTQRRKSFCRYAIPDSELNKIFTGEAIQ